MAPEAEPRNYHSVAVLLPDGTVFSGGGGLCGSCSTNHPDGQIFTPPYLLNANGTLATRPTITSAPTSAATGQTITVTTGQPVSQFSMVRYGESTHSVDNDQRRIPLSIVSSSSDTYQLAIPSDPGIALPGPYMLFALNASGTPSVSTTISITNVATQPPADGYGQAVFGAGPSSTGRSTTASGSATAADVERERRHRRLQRRVGSPTAPPARWRAAGQRRHPGRVQRPDRGVPAHHRPHHLLRGDVVQDHHRRRRPSHGLRQLAQRPVRQPRPHGVDGRQRPAQLRGLHRTGRQTAVVQSPQSYNDGNWHHVVATQGPDGMHLYVDGQLVGSNDTSQAQSYLGYWRVGGENLSGWPDTPSSNYFAGTVSDVAVYNSELSASQVESHYQASSGGPLPSPWTSTDVGGPQVAGESTYANGVYTVNGSGSDIWGSADQFQYADQPLVGDGTIVAQVTSQTATDPWAKAGIMIKQSAAAGAPYVLVANTPGNGVHMQYGFDSDDAGSANSPPSSWLELTRTGNTFTAYDSPDGSTWTEVGSVTLSMSSTATVGLFVNSHNPNLLGTATFANVSVTPSDGGPLPSPWTSTDVGGPQVAGESTYANGVYTVNGSGSDIWGSADQFQYADQPLVGDGTIVAQVTSQTATDPWAKAGIMIKQSAAAGAPYVLVANTPGNGVHMQYGFDSDDAGSANSPPSSWLELTRTGNTFTAYDSPDGSTWTEVGSVTLSMSSTATVGLFVNSHNPNLLGTATFANVSVTPSDGGPLPSPWTSTDVGGPQVAGESTYANGVYTVNGSGSDIWGSADQFQYADQPLVGDGTIVAQVTSQTATDPWAKAGIMIKQSAAAGAPYVLVANTPGNGVHMQYGFDSDDAGSNYLFPTAFPQIEGPESWLELTRTGNTFTAYDSPDGSTWTEVGSVTLSMSSTATVGLFVNSHNPNLLGTATFANVSVTPSDGGPLPSPWTSTDVGGPQVAGESTYANGVYTVNGSGSDIWGSADQFQYADQPLVGDGTIVAQVTSQTATDPWAKAGIMIKQSAAAGAPYVLVANTPGNGVHMQYGFDSDDAGSANSPPSSWLELTRTGNTFTAYDSPDGSTWTEVGSVTLSMSSTATVGLFVNSHNPNLLGTATFANVSVTPSDGGPLPSPWTSTDVGGPQVAGESTYANGVYTVNGSGSDIWGSADQFQYADQPLVGDGTIVAQVTSQTATDPWAKAGIMIKQSAAAGAPYVLVANTPGNGVHMQYGFDSDDAGSANSPPSSWLELTRTGNTFTAYDSPDGSTWTEVGSVTLSMSSTATVGLFVNSHNPNLLGTATFANVSVTPSDGGAQTAGPDLLADLIL